MPRKILLAGLLCLLTASLAGAADEKKPTQASTPAVAKGKNVVVLIETTLGNIKLELYPDKAPKTVENFLAYVNSGFYTDTIFHRVIPGQSRFERLRLERRARHERHLVPATPELASHGDEGQGVTQGPPGRRDHKGHSPPYTAVQCWSRL